MVIYNLTCKKNHQFEGWFPSSEGFEEQVKLKQVSCPVCSSTAVQKLPHACAIQTKKKERRLKRRQSSRAPAHVTSESEAKEIGWGDTLEPDDTADEEARIEIRGRNTDIESSRG